MADDPIKQWQNLSFMNKPMIPASQLSKQSGKPMYTREQLNVPDPLVKLWRQIVFKKGITYEYFIIKWKEYCRTHLCMSPYQINISVGNIKTPLYKNHITFKKFEAWMAALGYPIVGMKIESIEDGNPIVFDLNNIDS